MSAWKQITSGAAKFWDGVGGALGGIKDGVDGVIDILTMPKDLFKDSEGKYFGIMSGDEFRTGLKGKVNKDKKGGGNNQNQSTEESSTEGFVDIGSKSIDEASKYGVAEASTTAFSDYAKKELFPLQNTLELATGIDGKSYAEELVAVTEGQLPMDHYFRHAILEDVANRPDPDGTYPFASLSANNGEPRISFINRSTGEVHYPTRLQEQIYGGPSILERAFEDDGSSLLSYSPKELIKLQKDQEIIRKLHKKEGTKG
jgi:hypothetical protein